LRWSGGAEAAEDQNPGFSVAKTRDDPGDPKSNNLRAQMAKNWFLNVPNVRKAKGSAEPPIPAGIERGQPENTQYPSKSALAGRTKRFWFALFAIVCHNDCRGKRAVEIQLGCSHS
jgi:hypothetical protein